ncbi:DUF1327 domain-containing protein, partial [Shigella sonnei]|uniref:DUF1327 domain-containing protein n=2 Tax=Shigella sonnei TaxID=624 RepID=UPI001494AB27
QGKISSDGCLKKEQMVVSAIASTPQVFLDVAAGLCEGDEQSPEKRPVILEAQNVWITYKGKLPGRITGSLKTPPESQP